MTLEVNISGADASFCIVSRRNMALLARTMQRAGWEVDFVDLDVTRAQPIATIRCHRYDGRWLWGRVDEWGRCVIDTFQRKSWLGSPRGAVGPQSPQIDDVFLGRMRPVDARAMLSQITNYVADNALHPIPLSDLQNAWQRVMGAPARFVLEQSTPLNQVDAETPSEINAAPCL